MVMSSLISQAHGPLQSDTAVTNWPADDPLVAAPSDPLPSRLDTLVALNLDDHRSIPAFEEAIQFVREHLDIPVGWVSVASGTTEYLKATYGLSSLGLGNALAQDRQLPLTHSLSRYVLDHQRPWVLPDITQQPDLDAGATMATYGLVAYCAVPLMTSQRQCIGVLAVMDHQPRHFSAQDISFLAMAARWGMGEYERQHATTSPATQPQTARSEQAAVDAVRLHLVGQLVQDLCNPLTAVLGMTSMLSREIYGPLTEKQREYVEIVRHSSQTLMNQVDEILDLGLINPEGRALVANPVDIHRLGHQVLDTLTPLAETFSQTLDLTIEPNQGLWILDQHTIKQILYYAVFSLMSMASNNSVLRIHASRKGQSLALALWVSNPWLGEGLPSSMISLCQTLEQDGGGHHLEADLHAQGLLGHSLTPSALSKHWLGLLLCHSLAQHHGGNIRLHGSDDAGYRLVMTLPALHTSLSPISPEAMALGATAETPAEGTHPPTIEGASLGHPKPADHGHR
jgi:signal transduction histidine kinase